MDTKQKILTEAVKLFAKYGFDAVTVEMIAKAVGIKAPSLYKHYKSKEDIFNSVLKEMEKRDAENAAGSDVPQETKEEAPETYEDVPIPVFLEYCKKMFRYWTEDEFASSFRKMLTIEQYRSPEMNSLYHQYLGDGPLKYTADLIGSEEAALDLYAPMHFLYSVYDREAEYGSADNGNTNGRTASADNSNTNGGKAYEMLEKHLDSWQENYR